jgi:hypothetical protein
MTTISNLGPLPNFSGFKDVVKEPQFRCPEKDASSLVARGCRLGRCSEVGSLPRPDIVAATPHDRERTQSRRM